MFSPNATCRIDQITSLRPLQRCLIVLKHLLLSPEQAGHEIILQCESDPGAQQVGGEGPSLSESDLKIVIFDQ